MSEVRTREAREGDVEGIQEIFLRSYGEEYPYREFYDREWLKRALYGERMVMVVAEDTESGAILGTGSVDLDTGSHSDLVGEMGRLAVHPEARGRGVGGAIMERRVSVIEDRLHLALVENRTTHTHSQKISRRFGFVPVGFLPLKHRFVGRESVALYARHFGSGVELRKNHPRIVPAAHPVARLAMANLGLAADLVVDESSPAYPDEDEFDLSDLESEGLPDLLRIERGRVRGREVFGPMRLHYGFFRLAARKASYLVARRPGRPEVGVAGALGYLHDPVGRTIRIFELIAATDAPVRTLFQALLERAWDRGVEYVEVDVSADAPRLQRTLLELGFLPAAYVPAMAFHEVERLDVLKMVALRMPPSVSDGAFTEEARPIVEAVMEGFRIRSVLPELAARLGDLAVFRGLGEEQARRLAGAMSLRRFGPGELLFQVGEAAHELFVLLDGSVEVVHPRSGLVGTVEGGETVGENAMLAEAPHSASVRSRTKGSAAVLGRDHLKELVDRRPDIGVVLYRNLALGLGRKLREAGKSGSSEEPEP